MTDDKNKYILSINGMSKSFGRNKVLKHISMNVKPGTIMGLMGLEPIRKMKEPSYWTEKK